MATVRGGNGLADWTRFSDTTLADLTRFSDKSAEAATQSVEEAVRKPAERQ